MLWRDAGPGLISAAWHFFDPLKPTVRPGATRTDRVHDVIEANRCAAAWRVHPADRWPHAVGGVNSTPVLLSKKAMNIVLRKANLDDRPAITRLIGLSARGLSREDYSEEQIEGAIASVFGVDSDLIHDGTYFVAEASGVLVGCGGWSKRRTLFGGDQAAGRESAELDPGCEAARIRAFFVHPEWARQGIGRALLERCEAEAQADGFRSLELMATLPGLKLYQALGYVGSERIAYDLGGGVSIDFVPMRKDLPER